MDLARPIDVILGYYFYVRVLTQIILLLNPMVMEPINFLYAIMPIHLATELVVLDGNILSDLRPKSPSGDMSQTHNILSSITNPSVCFP